MLSFAASLTLVLVTLFVFAFVVALLGRHAFDEFLNPDESFLSARGQISWYSLGFSLYASSMGSWICFIPPELGAHLGGWSVALYAFAVMFPMVLMTWLGPLIKNAVGSTGFTLSDFVMIRFGRVSYVAVCGVALFSMWVALAVELCCVGRALMAMAVDHSFPPIAVILPVALVTLGYTTYGGLKATILTDLFQGVMVVVLAIVVVSAALINTKVPYNQFIRASKWTGQESVPV